MKIVRILLMTAIIFSFIGVYMNYSEQEEFNVNKNVSLPTNNSLSSTSLESIDNEQEILMPTKGLYTYLGKASDEVEESFGKPDRVEPSSYGYEWWVYNIDVSSYMQVGVQNNKVVTIFAIGENVNISPLLIGQPIDEVFELLPIESIVSLNIKNNSYRFELSEEELNVKPLVKIGDVFIQLYFDKFTSELSSVRYMDAETLIKLRPYELVYRGELLSAEELSPKKWEEVENGNAQQILEITNMIRVRHNLQPVLWNEKVANVAYKHSKDMLEENFFSHESPRNGGLSDRLSTGEVFFQLAGENIAAKYIDGIAVVEGWLNSEGHRKTLLNEKFTELGVGVYEKYYTQNFIQTWD